jgi:hypothetical protein
MSAEEIAELQARKQATVPRKTGDTYASYIRKWQVRVVQDSPATVLRLTGLCLHNSVVTPVTGHGMLIANQTKRQHCTPRMMKM